MGIPSRIFERQKDCFVGGAVAGLASLTICFLSTWSICPDVSLSYTVGCNFAMSLQVLQEFKDQEYSLPEIIVPTLMVLSGDLVSDCVISITDVPPVVAQLPGDLTALKFAFDMTS